MNGTGYAARLAEFAAGCREGVPEGILHDAAARTMDCLGNSLGALGPHGDHDPRASPQAAALALARAAGGSPQATVIGGGLSVPADRAALVNGTLAHALDFDDTHLPSVLHPTASVLPAALAVAEATGADGPALLAALAAGGEVCVRLGMASYDPVLRNSVFFEKGLHATSICGTVGAAVAAGLLYGLTSAELAHAIGIACSMGAGVIEANRTGGSVKRVHCGWAAHSGVCAAQFAAAGVTGPPTVLEGRFGFLTAFLDDRWHPEPLVRGLEDMGSAENWEYARTVFKPYPSNHFTHPGIDCALALRAQGLRAEDVVSACLGVASAPRRTIGEPRAEKVRPRTPYHAKFSGPYTVAAALLADVRGAGPVVRHADFSPRALADPARLSLAERVEVVSDAQCEDEFPLAFSAVLEVRTRRGPMLTARVAGSLGGPGRPLSEADLEEKFRSNAEPVLGKARAEEVVAAVRSLPEAPRGAVAALLPLTVPG
ncbi:MmgE/PrpD family protein [Streptomyces sp. NPDC058612]|uniref:MmgE/PrpD family protein n=1 Tax=Streptomyces sp. NPDC058612 TaxID=3346555 RepID=UPI003652BE26